jgi:hypothetical protein
MARRSQVPERAVPAARDPWRVYRGWFWAATAYNLVWGTVVGLRPQLLLDWMGMTSAQQTAAGPLPLILSACIGMFVGVYAIGYAAVALDPARFWPLALLGLCGKVLGPLGAVLHIALKHLPPGALWVNLFNDAVWWPAFVGLLLTVWREWRSARIRLGTAASRAPRGSGHTCTSGACS